MKMASQPVFDSALGDERGHHRHAPLLPPQDLVPRGSAHRGERLFRHPRPEHRVQHLGHLAFWDARALSLAEKLEAGVPFSPADHEPEDVDPVNAAVHALLNAMPPRQVAELTVRLAEETDRRVATLDPQRLWPEDPGCPLNPLRASHRAEHLDHIEAALR